MRDLSLAVYRRGAEEAAKRGIIIADIKMEFGLLGGEVILIDGLFTPGSSRFWLTDRYQVGVSQESLDKQYIRDYLSTLDWDKTDPGPTLSPEVVAETTRRYREILAPQRPAVRACQRAAWGVSFPRPKGRRDDVQALPGPWEDPCTF